MAGAVRHRIRAFHQAWRAFSSAVLVADGGKNDAIDDILAVCAKEAPPGRNSSLRPGCPPVAPRACRYPRAVLP